MGMSSNEGASGATPSVAKETGISKYALGAAGVCAGAAVCYVGWKWLKKQKAERAAMEEVLRLFHGTGATTGMVIVIVSTVVECRRAVARLEEALRGKVPIVGLDAEWTTAPDGRRDPVSLLQLSCGDLCVLFRLNFISSGQRLPAELVDFLADPRVLKCGVGIRQDAHHLIEDYSLRTITKVADIAKLVDSEVASGNQYLQRLPGVAGGARSLKALASDIVGVGLKKDVEITCSDWSARSLTVEQIAYAAADAWCSWALVHKIYENARVSQPDVYGEDDAIMTLAVAATEDVHYNDVGGSSRERKKSKTKEKRGQASAALGNAAGLPDVALTRNRPNLSSEQLRIKIESRKRAATKGPVYGNGIISAPDGRVLARCDKRKIDWYLRQGIAELVSDDPPTIRLKFEPKGSNAAHDFNVSDKKNECVRCHSEEALSRFHIVPRCIRMQMPDRMKSHNHHDVVLLCVPCHLLASDIFQEFQEGLSRKHGVPVSGIGSRTAYNQGLVKVRNAAKALKHGKALPNEKRLSFLSIVEEHLGRPADPEAISELCELATRQKGEFVSFGKLVVDKIVAEGATLGMDEEASLSNLVVKCRKLFLEKLAPKNLPDKWDVNFRTLNNPNSELPQSGQAPSVEARGRMMLSKLLGNAQLVHDLMVDPSRVNQFKESASHPKDPMQVMADRVAAIARKAFWDVIREELLAEPPSYRGLLSLIGEIKVLMLGLVQGPSMVDTRAQVNDILDLDLIKQMLDNNAFDKSSMRSMVGFCLGTLRSLEAPVRNDETDDFSAKMNQDLDKTSTLTESLMLLPGLLDFLFGKIETIKKDTMSAELNMLVPYLQQHGVQYLRERFNTAVDEGKVGMTRTKAWWSSAVSDHGPRFAAAAALQKSAPGRGQGGVDQTQLLMATHRVAILGLVTSPNGIQPDTCPETLLLGLREIHAMQNELQRITLTAVLVMIYRQVCAMTGCPSPSDGAIEECVEVFGRMLGSPATRLATIGAAMAEQYAKARGAPAEEEHIAIISKLVDKMTEPSDHVHTLVRGRLHDTFQTAILCGLSRLAWLDRENDLPQIMEQKGLKHFTHIIQAVRDRFLRVASLDWSTHGELYVEEAAKVQVTHAGGDRDSHTGGQSTSEAPNGVSSGSFH